MKVEHCYECEDCGCNIDPTEAIATGVDDWGDCIAQLYICPVCANSSQYDYEDFIDDSK